MPSTDFTSLPLPQAMLDNLQQLKLHTMTPVQAQSLPLLLEKKDVIAQAKTGSGKTVAFGIGLLTKIKPQNFTTQALILCPTRELATQVATEVRRLARFADNIKVLTLCGGVPMGPQVASLKHNAHVVVGTPGRVLKHIEKKSLTLNHIDSLVLDEADRMLDMGFIDVIKTIIATTPATRQTLLFSATYPREIIHLSEGVQTSPANISSIDEDSDINVSEHFLDVAPDDRVNTLLAALRHYQPTNAIIFTNTRTETKTIAKSLKQLDIEVLALHGDMEQSDRDTALVKFSNGSASVLVATDVAARGLDIKDLSMVVNVGLPHDKDIYTHRIGRTGRAGGKGVAVTIFSGREAMKAENYHSENRHFDDHRDLDTTHELALNAPNRTLLIHGGKKDKLRAGDILGALTKELNFDGGIIGKITIYDKQSYVAIAKDSAYKVCRALNSGRIKGRKFAVKSC